MRVFYTFVGKNPRKPQPNHSKIFKNTKYLKPKVFKSNIQALKNTKYLKPKVFKSNIYALKTARI